MQKECLLNLCNLKYVTRIPIAQTIGISYLLTLQKQIIMEDKLVILKF